MKQNRFKNKVPSGKLQTDGQSFKITLRLTARRVETVGKTSDKHTDRLTGKQSHTYISLPGGDYNAAEDKKGSAPLVEQLKAPIV